MKNWKVLITICVLGCTHICAQETGANETFLVYLDKILLYHTAHCIIICAKIQTIRQIHNR